MAVVTLAILKACPFVSVSHFNLQNVSFQDYEPNLRVVFTQAIIQFIFLPSIVVSSGQGALKKMVNYCRNQIAKQL